MEFNLEHARQTAADLASALRDVDSGANPNAYVELLQAQEQQAAKGAALRNLVHESLEAARVHALRTGQSRDQLAGLAKIYAIGEPTWYVWLRPKSCGMNARTRPPEANTGRRGSAVEDALSA
jgi:hypothetical protein